MYPIHNFKCQYITQAKQHQPQSTAWHSSTAIMINMYINISNNALLRTHPEQSPLGGDVSLASPLCRLEIRFSILSLFVIDDCNCNDDDGGPWLLVLPTPHNNYQIRTTMIRMLYGAFFHFAVPAAAIDCSAYFIIIIINVASLSCSRMK